MPYMLTVDSPNLAEGAPVFIRGLGSFENGKAYEISDEQDEAFRQANMVDVGGVDTDPGTEEEPNPSYGAYTPKYELGPSLGDVQIHGVKIEKSGDTPATDTKNDEATIVDPGPADPPVSSRTTNSPVDGTSSGPAQDQGGS